jgi:choline-sulfatase
MASPPRRNLLFLISDQHAASAMGCAGNHHVATPSLDRLAADGVRFTAAYTTNPVCVPGRFALYTGRHVHTVETVQYPSGGDARHLPAALSLRERTFGHHFRDAGYVTGFVGKMHPVAPHTLGFDYLVDFGHYADFLGPRYETFARGMGAVDSGCGVPWVDVLRDGEGSPWLGAPLSAGQPVVYPDETDHQEGFAAREALRFLGAYRDQPFCLAVSFLKPHAPWLAAPRYRAAYDPDNLPLPAAPAVPPGDDPTLPRAVRRIGQRFWQPHETWPLPPPGDPAREEAQRRWLAAYYACTTQMDAAVGQVLEGLDRLGLAESTLVVYTSDHGEMLGEHGLYQKFVFYEGAARVPLLVRCPWLDADPGAAGAPVDFVDLVPTCLDLCGLPVPAADGPGALDGASLAPLLREPLRAGSPGKGFAFGEMTYPEGPAYMIRAGDWKYVHYTGAGERSLFDLARDPGEQRDLAGSGAAAVEADLRARLLGWLPPHLPR